MSDLEYDYVVVGAGIVGSWTAKELSKYGKVLLLEQFCTPHTRGSSHGQSRIIRSSYSEPFFADMMPHAFRMWRQAEAEMNDKLIETTGILCIADSKENKDFLDCIENMKKVCPENFVELSASDLKRKFPTTLKYSDDVGVILDKSGGVVFAHKAVGTIQKWFESSGGNIWDCCMALQIVPVNEHRVKIVTNKRDVFAKSVVVCAGPWTQKLLKNLSPSLPLQPEVVKVFYWKEKEVGAYSISNGFPVILQYSDCHIYALPSLEYPGLVKVCRHGGTACDPDERDMTVANPKLELSTKDYIEKHLPMLESEPSIVETCMYTCTPDEVFLIDTLPKYKNIVIGTGFSGTGFKTSPVVGRLLGELARGVDPFLDITPYRLSRFLDKKTSSSGK